METFLNVAYHLIALFLVVLLAWNTVTLPERKRQIMSAIVLIPLVLRLLNLK